MWICLPLALAWNLLILWTQWWRRVKDGGGSFWRMDKIGGWRKDKRIKDGGRLFIEVCGRLNQRLVVFGIMGLERRVIDWNLEWRGLVRFMAGLEDGGNFRGLVRCMMVVIEGKDWHGGGIGG